MKFLQSIASILFFLIVIGCKLSLITSRTLKFVIKSTLLTRIVIKIAMIRDSEVIMAGPVGSNDTTYNKLVQRSSKVKLEMWPEPVLRKNNGPV